jgi:hypothetical protein
MERRRLVAKWRVKHECAGCWRDIGELLIRCFQAALGWRDKVGCVSGCLCSGTKGSLKTFAKPIKPWRVAVDAVAKQ